MIFFKENKKKKVIVFTQEIFMNQEFQVSGKDSELGNGGGWLRENRKTMF